MSDQQPTATVIESAHYADVRNRLAAEGSVRDMAASLKAGMEAGAVDRDQWLHADGKPTFEFMQRANTEYERISDLHTDRHIGAVAEAIVQIWKEQS